MWRHALSVANKTEFPSPEIIPNAVTDEDGHTYDAVKIGEQIWMAENLRATKYKSSRWEYDTHNDTLTSVYLGDTIIELGADDYKYPNNDPANTTVYGLLYRYGIVPCPTGWHLPSNEEFETLKETVAKISGKKEWKTGAFLAGDAGWEHSNQTYAAGNLNAPGRNFTGFSAQPAGVFETYNSYGPEGFGQRAQFWSSSSSYDYHIYSWYIYWEEGQSHDGGSLTKRTENGPEGYYYSVRCVKNYWLY